MAHGSAVFARVGREIIRAVAREVEAQGASITAWTGTVVPIPHRRAAFAIRSGAGAQGARSAGRGGARGRSGR